jgi:tetratricopeptide (TPR) repeat protein
MRGLKVIAVVALILLTSCMAGDFRVFGIANLQQKNYDAAISNFKTAVNMDPSDGNNHFWLGRAYYLKGDYKNAVVHLKKATELQPNDVYNHYWLAQVYMKTGKWQEAVSSLKKAIQIKPTNSDYFKGLSYCYNELHQYDNAITAAKRAIELKPDNVSAYNNLGYAYAKNKQYDEAFKAFKKAIELNPQNAVPYGNFGFFLVEKGNYAEAAEQYKKAVSLQPNNLAYLSRLASAYYMQGKYDDALDTINKTVAISTFTGIGTRIQIVAGFPVVTEVFESRPAKKAGIQKEDRIIKIDGKSTKGLALEKVIQKLRGQEGAEVVLTIKREGVKKPFEKTLTREKIIPKETAPNFGYRSLIQRHRGSREEALKDAELAYSLNSSDDWARLALGASYLDRGRYEESIELLSQVKDSTWARLLEATAHAKQGNVKKAVDIYSSIPEEKLSPKDVPLWSDRNTLLQALKPFVASKKENAKTLQAQGRYKEALDELGDALKAADDTDSKEICRAMSEIIRRDPRLSELPEEARKYVLRGEVLTEEGNFEEAAKEYRKAVQAAPYIAKLHLNTAMVYGELKKYPMAIRYMKTFLQLAPEAPNARAAQDQIYKWELMVEKGK